MRRNPSKHFHYSAIFKTFSIHDIEMCSLPWTLTHPLFGFSDAVIVKTNNKVEISVWRSDISRSGIELCLRVLGGVKKKEFKWLKDGWRN